MAADDVSAWLCNSNEVISMRLVRDPSQTTYFKPLDNEDDDEDEDQEIPEDSDEALLEPFHPEFTYPIFGEKEKIFGYKGLKIELNFSSSSLKQFLSITYDSKISSKATPADEIEETLYKFIPSDYTKSLPTFLENVKKEAFEYKPPGELFSSYKSKEEGVFLVDVEGVEEGVEVVYEVYKCNWKTPGFLDLHRRMQIFILMYIEGGSYIQEDEENWEFLVLYEKRTHSSPTSSSSASASSSKGKGKGKATASNSATNGAGAEGGEDNDKVSSYHFVGYVSAYPFWCWPEHVRLRLSQFVISPPYQGRGHGSQLYNALYSYALTLPQCKELTIEDPSEQFEDLRDRNDLKRLMKSIGGSKEIVGGAPVDKVWAEKVRKEGKYAKRQFERLIEMLLLQNLDKNDKAAYRAFRLQVKERLFRFNYEILAQVELEERKAKLQETFENVEADYFRLLDSVDSGRGFDWIEVAV